MAYYLKGDYCYSKGVGNIDNTSINHKINVIIENYSFKEYLSSIEDLEKHREFCKHGMQHLLDVARLMYIINLENTFNIPKHMIYATALLHDIGRGEQYKNGTPHDIASVKIANHILLECNYNAKEIEEILGAIGKHRSNTKNLNSLSQLLYKCDKLSRNCFKCNATYNCKWTKEKKNFNITY